jgi:PhnB protein
MSSCTEDVEWAEAGADGVQRFGSGAVAVVDVNAVAVRVLSLAVPSVTPNDAERIYNTLAEDGTVAVPLQETFWALRYGWVTDRFGIP